MSKNKNELFLRSELSSSSIISWSSEQGQSSFLLSSHLNSNQSQFSFLSIIIFCLFRSKSIPFTFLGGKIGNCTFHIRVCHPWLPFLLTGQKNTPKSMSPCSVQPLLLLSFYFSPFWHVELNRSFSPTDLSGSKPQKSSNNFWVLKKKSLTRRRIRPSEWVAAIAVITRTKLKLASTLLRACRTSR